MVAGVAVHEYPYRDTVWVEDLGRSARKFTLRGFLDTGQSGVQRGGCVQSAGMPWWRPVKHPAEVCWSIRRWVR